MARVDKDSREEPTRALGHRINMETNGLHVIRLFGAHLGVIRLLAFVPQVECRKSQQRVKHSMPRHSLGIRENNVNLLHSLRQHFGVDLYRETTSVVCVGVVR
jgi:hypothetical protein